MTNTRNENGAAEPHGRMISVYYGETVFELKPGSYDGSTLATLFSVPAGYILDFVNEDGIFEDLNPNQRVEIRQGMKFVSHPPVGQSS